MSIESRMKAVIESRSNNFYDMFDEYTPTSSDVYSDDATSPYFGYTAAEIFAAKNAGESVPTEVLEWAYAQTKSLYTPSGDPDFDMVIGFNSDGTPIYDPDKFKTYNQKMARTKAVQTRIESNANRYYTDDESSRFYGLTYEEILALADSGESIPDDILNWANEMAANAPEENGEPTENSNDAQALYLSLKNNPSLNIKSIAVIFTKKCEQEDREIDAYLEEIDPIEKEMEAASIDAETKKQEALNEIKTLVEEWKNLQRKMENGEELSEDERYRIEELQVLFGEADRKFQKEIDKTTENFTETLALLEFATDKSKTAFDFGEQTVEVAKELAEYERTHKHSSRVYGGLVGAGVIGVLEAISISGNRNYSKTANTVGVSTQNFALDFQTTIDEVHALMQATADTAGFDLEDPTFTVAPLINDESISEPSLRVRSSKAKQNTPPPTSPDEPPSEPGDVPPEGEGNPEVPPEGENPEGGDEPSDEDLLNNGEKTLEDIDAKTLSLPQLKKLIQLEGEDSEKKGQEALQLVEKLKAQSAAVDEQEVKVEEDTNALKEASEQEPTEGEDAESDSTVEDAQTTAEGSQEDLNNATEEEALTVDGLREVFKASTKANKKYSKDVKEADTTMKENIFTGAFTIAGGGYMTGVGIFNIVTGTSLLASAGWWNPAIIALATYMINTGSSEVALGSAMIAGGTALTISATEGLKIDDEASEKIGISNENITTANESLDEIEREQKAAIEGENSETENPEETDDTEEPTEDDSLSEDKSLLEKMHEGNKILPGMRQLVTDDGKKSSAMGNENVEKLTELERQMPSLIEATIMIEQAKQEEAAEGAEQGGEETVTDVQDPAEIYEEYRQDYKADLETNKKYKQDIKETSDAAKTNLGYAALGTAAGSARIALGSTEIATGTILAAQWFNPVAMMLGLALIKKGIEDTALGTEMLSVGLALTVNSTVTIAANEIADAKVDESNEKTNNSLARVDEIEAEINAAVQEQLAATGEQDLSGMSVIQLLTLIISHGIKSSVLGTENEELIEALKERLPELIENAKGTAQSEDEENTDKTENAGDSIEETEENQEEEGNEEEEKASIFTQYKNDFNADLETNKMYSSEINQAQNMSPILSTSFFLGAPIDKANEKIATSNEQTSNALEQVEEMEAKVEEAKKANDEVEETVGAVKTAAKGKKEDEEITPEDAESSVEDADDEEKDAEKENKKNARDEKKTRSKIKKNDKILKKADKTAKKSDKEGKAQEKQGAEFEVQGEEKSQEANPEDAQASADEATNELGEAQDLAGEVEELVSETEEEIEGVRNRAKVATAENQVILSEMGIVNNELLQDQNKIKDFENQIKQENQKSKSASKPKQAPAQKQEPAAPVAPKKNKAVQPKPEQNKPENPQDNQQPEQPQQTPAKAPAKAPAQPSSPDEDPTVANAPAGANKVKFASDYEKQPDFVGFVAQSDSLASGSVFNTPATTQGNNGSTAATSGNGGADKAKPTQKSKTNAKKPKSSQEKKQAQGEEEAPQAKASARSTQKAFNIDSMNGDSNGNGQNKTKVLRASIESIKTAAFNKQAKLSAMSIRANNNVMANIQAEALAQAQAAKKARLAQEKQERIAKIKQYAQIVQSIGGLTTTAGMIVEKVGTAQVTTGTAQVSAGTTQTTAGSTQVATGTAQVTAGQTLISTGFTQVSTGEIQVATGTSMTASGTTMTTTGTTMIATGTAMLSNPFTAAAGAAMVTAGTSLVTSGTSLVSTGTAMVASGTVQIATGTASIASGTAQMGAGFGQIAAGNIQIATGTAQVVSGTLLVTSGTALVGTGVTIQTIGAIVTATGAVVSAGADIANGNILGGIASIVGAAASVVGVAAPVSQLGNAAIQVASQGVSLAGQLATTNAGQDNNNNNNQDQKKKKQFKENQRTQGIIKKTQKKKQAVGNRFNK